MLFERADIPTHGAKTVLCFAALLARGVNIFINCPYCGLQVVIAFEFMATAACNTLKRNWGIELRDKIA